MTRDRLIVIGPLPPPVHGVTVSTSLVLANAVLNERFQVEHLDTSDHRSRLGSIGTWDAANIYVALSAVIRLLVRLRRRRGLVYLPLSQSTPGFLRDSLFIVMSHALRWRVAAHLRGSDFRSYYETSPWFMQWWIRLTLRRVDSMAVVGESLRWVFEGLVAEEHVAVVPNGTPEPALVDPASEPQHVLFLSSLRRRKGVVEALHAALIVVARRPSARFIFAGEWDDLDLEQTLRARAARASGAIDFMPTVRGHEKDMLLANATVLLFPPVEPEGHPRVVLEALAAGVPVVTTNRGAIGETVTDGENGFVLDDADPGALATCVLTLLDDPELRGRFSRAARGAYLEHFTQARADQVLGDWLTGVR